MKCVRRSVYVYVAEEHDRGGLGRDGEADDDV